MTRLTNVLIKSLQSGFHSDGGGLFLDVRDTGKSWVYRYKVGQKQRKMGLGAYPAVSIKEARLKAAEARALRAKRIDPLDHKEVENRPAVGSGTTLNDIVPRAFEARKHKLVGNGIAGRWLSPLKLHILPHIGGKQILDIDQFDLEAAFKDIWHTKKPTSDKAWDRLRYIFDYAESMDIDVDMRIFRKAKKLLGEQNHEVEHIPSMPYQEIPAFYSSLIGKEALGHLALRMAILIPGSRSTPIRNMHLDQIDGDVWTIPGKFMKDGKERREPLSRQALDLIEALQPNAKNGYLFPATDRSKADVISDVMMSRIMRDFEYRPHGFRTSLRVWSTEVYGALFEVAEKAIAHKVGNKVTRTYLRTDALEQRSELMQAWADHVTSHETEIIHFPSRA